MSSAVSTRQSDDLLQLLLDMMPDHIYFKDREGRFTHVSSSLARFYGVARPEDVLGKTDFDFYPEEDAHRYRADELAILSGDGCGLVDHEEQCCSPAGDMRQFRTTKVPVRDASGAIIGIAGISREVTDFRRTEAALRESDQQFRRVFESSMLGIHFWDAAGNVTQANDAYLNMLGYTREDLRAHRVRWRDLTPPEFAAVDDHHLNQMLEHGVCEPFEKQYIRKDGRRISILLGAALLPGSQHEGVAFALDRTELKRAEAELNRQRREQETMLDSVPAMIWYKDCENRCIRANQAAAAAAGLTKQEFEGRPTSEIYPDQAEAFFRDDLSVINSGKPKMGIIEHIPMPDGSRRWLRTDKIPHRDGEGRIIGVVVFATDITELKDAEDALRREQQLMQILMDNMPDAIYFKDRDSRFLRSNKAQARIMGLADPGEAIGKDDTAFFPAHDARAFRADELRLLETGTPLVSRIEHHGGATGEMRWWSTTKVPVRDAAGNIVGIAGITRDISPLKRAEEEIRTINEELEQRVIDRTAKLEAANARLEAEARERLLAEEQIRVYQQRLQSLASELSLAEERERRRIAVDLHDQIGQTLALIQIKLQALCDAAPPAVAAELADCVDLIRQPIHDTRSLVFNLSPPILYDLGFEAAAAWLVDQHQGRAGLRITFHDDHRHKPLDEAVSVLLFRAIRELLTNVVKHSRARTAQVWLREDHGRLHAGVEDDGQGFAATERTGAGAGGFGLFSIREQLGRVGGTMEIQSGRKRGSAVVLTVPLASANTPSPRSEGQHADRHPAG